MLAAHYFFFFQPSAPPPAGVTGVGAITEAPDTLAGTAFTGPGGVIQESPEVLVSTGTVSVTGTGAIVEAPDTTGQPVADDEFFVTPGRIRREKPDKKPAERVERADSPRLRKLRQESKKLAAERLRLEGIRSQMEVFRDDAEMQEMLRREAEKAAAEFGRVAGNYLSLDRRNKMMAMLLALLMEE